MRKKLIIALVAAIVLAVSALAVIVFKLHFTREVTSLTNKLFRRGNDIVFLGNERLHYETPSNKVQWKHLQEVTFHELDRLLNMVKEKEYDFYNHVSHIKATVNNVNNLFMEKKVEKEVLEIFRDQIRIELRELNYSIVQLSKHSEELVHHTHRFVQLVGAALMLMVLIIIYGFYVVNRFNKVSEEFIINSMSNMLLTLDESDSVILWNNELEKMTGISSESAKGKNWRELMSFLEPHLDKIEKLLRDNEEGRIKIEVKRGKQIYHYQVYLKPLLGVGVKGSVLRINDLSQEFHMQEVMIQTEKMMSLGGLSAGMAHELNNPLGVVVQGVQNIERRLSLDLPGNIKTAQELDLDMVKLREYLEKRGILGMIEGMRSAAKRAADIIANMLLFSRRNPNVEKKLVHPTVLVKESLELVSVDYNIKKKYDFRNINVVTEFDPDTPDIHCIATEIEQVLLNLFKNAARAMFDQEREKKIMVRCYPIDSSVRIEVEDTGPGMDEETVNRIFEPFYTTSKGGEGTGLGLSVSYFIINDSHKGQIEVQSTLGKGTLFTITLPV